MKSDARATIEHSILTAIANTSLETKLTAGKSIEALVSEIVKEVFDKAVLWSVEEYATEVKKEASS